MVLVFVTALALYLALWPRFSDRLDPLTGDEPFYVMTAISLFEDQDLDQSNNYTPVTVVGDSGPYVLYAFDDSLNPPDPLPPGWNGWANPPRLVGAHEATSDRPGLYTKHGVGLSALIAAPWSIVGRFGANFVVMVAGALLAAQMYLLARQSGAGNWLAGAISLGLAIAMPIGPYALLLFPEVPAALLLLYAIRRSAAHENEWWQWLLTGGAVGFLPWLHQRFAPTAVALSIVLIIRLVRSRKSLQNAALSLVPIGIGGIALLTYNLWLYGAPFQRSEDHAGFNRIAGTINGGFGLVLDAQWGLLVAAPVLVLALAALPRWYLALPRLATIALIAIAPYLVVVAAYKVWWGEWGPPARYLVPVVPLAAGPIATWLSTASGPARLLGYALWVIGFLMTMVGFQDPQRFYHHPDGRNNLVLQLGDQFHLDFQRFLVAFQPYATAPFASRFWISAAFLFVLLFASYLVSGDAIQEIISKRSGLTRRIFRIEHGIPD